MGNATPFLFKIFQVFYKELPEPDREVLSMTYSDRIGRAHQVIAIQCIIRKVGPYRLLYMKPIQTGCYIKQVGAIADKPQHYAAVCFQVKDSWIQIR